MTGAELSELIRNGEDSTLEFKRANLRNYELAKELVAFLNLEGGTVLLGVEADGRISGATRHRLEEWVSELCRVKIEPPIVPLLSWARDPNSERDVLAVRVSLGPDKPYARVHDGRRTYYIRVGSTSREASREELERLFQSSGLLHYGLKPVPGAGLDALDRRRLHDYLTGVLGGPVPPDDVASEWETLLRNIDLMVVSAGQTVATIDGLLLFGMTPNRYLPQAGIRAICYPGSEPDYATRADEDLRGPLVALGASGGVLGRPAPRQLGDAPRRGLPSAFLDRGLVEQAWDFVRRNTTPTARLDNGRRTDRWEYPESVLREAVVNALVHRDYSISGADIMLAIFADRIEIQSPGRLPNTVTPEGMRAGVRYARNQTLVNVMRDYGYVDARGMGVRNKIIPGMRAHNGTEPDLIAEDHRFTVRLWKETPGRAP
ncbi:MAG: putative DNA binding domain-containing protein [Acidobacteria bacterium]|nr:putative DNA binding domain-containing protein [Acidobacteriota bacterium]